MSSAFSSTQEENKQNCVAKSKFCTYNPRPHIQHAFPHTQLVSLFRYLTRSPFTRGLGKIRFLRDGRAATARVGALDPDKDGRAVTRPELLSMLSAAAECCQISPQKRIAPRPVLGPVLMKKSVRYLYSAVRGPSGDPA